MCRLLWLANKNAYIHTYVTSLTAGMGTRVARGHDHTRTLLRLFTRAR